MSLKAAVAVPFRQEGVREMGEGEFVVALSLDRDWFSPDQAKRLIDVASGQGLLTQDGSQLQAEFDPATVEVPEDFVPDEDILREQSTFEQVLDAVVAAGEDKQTAVAGINELQRDLAITLEAAAVVYARRRDIDVSDVASKARASLRED